MDFYIMQDLMKRGPFTLEELRQRGITPETLVQANGSQQWATAGSVHELAALFVAPQAPIAEPVQPTATQQAPVNTPVQPTPQPAVSTPQPAAPAPQPAAPAATQPIPQAEPQPQAVVTPQPTPSPAPATPQNEPKEETRIAYQQAQQAQQAYAQPQQPQQTYAQPQQTYTQQQAYQQSQQAFNQQQAQSQQAYGQQNYSQQAYGQQQYAQQPGSYTPLPQYKTPAIIMLVFGILSCCCCMFNIPLIVFGILGMNNDKKAQQYAAQGQNELALASAASAKKMLMWGLIGGIAWIVLSGVVSVIIAMADGSLQETFDILQKYQ